LQGWQDLTLSKKVHDKAGKASWDGSIFCQCISHMTHLRGQTPSVTALLTITHCITHCISMSGVFAGLHSICIATGLQWSEQAVLTRKGLS